MAHSAASPAAWRNRTRATMSTAALTTGGGLVIVGGNDRYLYVHDAADGRILYQTRLHTSPQGFPATYSVGGRPVPRRAGREREPEFVAEWRHHAHP